MDNTNNNFNINSNPLNLNNNDGINVNSFALSNNLTYGNEFNFELAKSQQEYLRNYRVMQTMLGAFWDESNGIFCNTCGAQVNYWENPNGDLVITSYSVYNDLQEKQYNQLSEKDKLLYNKCTDCFTYKKINSGKPKMNDCCKLRNTFKFTNGSILNEN